MKFGERLKVLRTEKPLTLSQLADELELTPATLSRYEREERQPDFETTEKIANYFDVSIDYLIGRTDYKTSDERIFSSDVKNLENKLKTASPEIRKLLVDIVDSTYLLLDRNIEQGNKSTLELFAHIYRELNKLDTILEQTRMLSKLTTNKNTIAKLNILNANSVKNNIEVSLSKVVELIIEVNLTKK